MKAFPAPFLIALLAVGPFCLAADPPTTEKSSETGELRYRRVYYPEGMKDWSKGNVKYLPMDAEEFDHRLEAIQRTAPGGPAQGSVGFVEAHYDARLEGPSLLQGSATLKVSQSIASATLVTLDPCNLAIARAQWVTSDGDPAVLGITGDGKLQVLAQRAGQMKFDWSLAGHPDPTGGVSFAIALPPSPVNRLRVELPADLAASVDRGILGDEGPADRGFHRWRLDLGGWSECRLRLAKAGSAEARQQAGLASQSLAYDFSLRDLELSVHLNVEAHREPLRKLVVGLDPSLELIAVSSGDTSLSWKLVAGASGKMRQLAIEIPPSLQEGAASLRLQAFAPLITGRSWKLPRMIFEGVVCRSNAIRLSVPSPLYIDHLDAHGCRQTGVAVLKTSAGEQLDFECFAADATVDVTLSQRPSEVQATSATTTRLGQGKMSSRVATDFRTREGPVFMLEAEVLPNWTIDSVESQPANALDDWTLSRGGGGQKVSIRLARPLTSAPPLRLIVSARRLYAYPGRNLGIDDFVPLRFVGLSESKRWVDLYAIGADELNFTPANHLQRADVKDLTAAEFDLFAEPPGDLLFRDDLGASELRFSLEDRRPSYSSSIHVEAVAGDAVLAENYAFLCTPSKAVPIDRVVVHFAGHREGPLSWSVVGADGSRFSARRWTAQQESVAGFTANEEAWDVAFHSPRSSPVEIRASRKSRLVGPTPVCLASLPDAARQEATVTVRSLGPRIVQFKTRRLQPVPTQSAPPGQVQTARASYQYDPRTETTPPTEPALVLTEAGTRSAAAWVWNCEIRSQLAADGDGDHTVRYSIQNAGSRQICLTLPDGLLRSDVHGILVDDKPAAALGRTGPLHEELFVDLPADLKTVAVEVRFSTHGKPLGTFSRLRPPLPEIGLPVFSRHWSLCLPPGYILCDSGQDPQAAQDASFSLRRCLLGGLGRGWDQAVFEPWHGDDWRSLLGRETTEERPADPGAAAKSIGRPPFSIDLVDAAPTVIVVRSAALDAWGWVLFLALVGMGALGLSGRPFTLLLLAVLLGLPALLSPAAISRIFSHGLLGVVFCLVLGLVKRRMAASGPAAAGSNAEVPSTLTNIVPFGAPLLAVAMLCGSNSVTAAEPAKSPPVTHSVFIPLDETQQPTHGKYFLPEPFYAELYHRDALHAEKPQGFLIASAVYRAALADDAAHAGYVVDRLAVELGIRVFNASARVRIPLHRDEVSLEPGQAKLDDRPVQPDWDADGSALLLEIAEPGEQHRLELTLRPTVRPDRRPAALDLAIPRVPTARLELTVPAGGPRVEFPSALGAARWEEVQSRWSVDLGPSDRLAASCQDPILAGPEADVDVEQLLWLRIEQGCALLDVRMKVKASGDQLRRLLVRADPALELLPSTSPAVPTVQILGRGDSWQTYEIQWPQPIGSATTFDMHFLCPGDTGVGTFRVPQINVADAKLVRRSLAVSIDPALEQLPGAKIQETGAVREFIDNWGAGDPPPEMAFRLNGNAAEWSLVTRARRAETSGDQNVTWSFSAQSAVVQLDVQLTTVGGSMFQYRLEAPPSLLVDSIAVQVEGRNRAARWSQDKDGHISVFLASPLSGRHELQLHGQMPLPSDRKLALPQIRLEEVRIQNSIVSLYRQPDILVDVSGVAKLADVRTIVDDAGPGDLGRPVRSFYADLTGISPVLVTIKPNRPRVRAEQVTRVVCKDNLWRTTSDFSLHVSEGMLDAFELDVPSSWKESVKTSPAMADTFSAGSNQRATLVLSPAPAISADYKFTLTGPPVAAAQFAVPDVSLRHVESMRRYVVLPNSADRRPIDWDRKNLRQCDAMEGDPDDTKRYEVVGESWQAALSPPQKEAAPTRVVQADVRYAWQPDGRCLGAAFLDVETAGAIDCPLQLPEGYDLLQLTVDGLPVDAVRGAAGSWAVPLASPVSTSRVELLFFAESALPRASTGWTRRYSFRAPKLGDLPVDLTAWTIASPRAWQASVVGDGQFDAPPASSGNAKVGDIAAQWRQLVENGQTAVSYVTGGATDAIVLDYRPPGSQSWLPRLAAIGGFLAVVGLVALLVRRGLLWTWFARWPYLLGIGIGLAWWLWLSPSALGLFIVLAVVLRQLVPWRTFRRPAAASTHHAPS